MAKAKLVSWVRRMVWLLALCAAAALAFLILRPAPQDLPWTPLKLGEPIGLFTGRKLTGLTGDPARCVALLRDTGLQFEQLPPRGEGRCRAEDVLRVSSGQEMLSLSPATVAPSCPVVAALALWNWQVLQPAAQRIFGLSVASIHNLGSHTCRRMYGRTEGAWSEHATADAIDVSGFTLSDGRRISVLRDWKMPGKDAEFLKEVRDGGCRLFATVLSPDYNAQHADHLHLDQAERGEMGWRACR